MSFCPTIILPISSRRRRRSSVNVDTVCSMSREATAALVLSTFLSRRRRLRHLVRLDLVEVLLDVILVGRRHLLGLHDLLDAAVVLGVDLLVLRRREALLRRREDRLALRRAALAL